MNQSHFVFDSTPTEATDRRVTDAGLPSLRVPCEPQPTHLRVKSSDLNPMSGFSKSIGNNKGLEEGAIAPASRGNKFQTITSSGRASKEHWTSDPLGAFDVWMASAQRGRGFKARSQTVYRSMWRKLVKHAGPEAAFLDEGTLGAFLGTVTARGSDAVSPTQQRRYLVLLSSIQADLVQSGALVENSAQALLQVPTMKDAALRRSLPVALSPEREERLKRHLDRTTVWGAQRAMENPSEQTESQAGVATTQRPMPSPTTTPWRRLRDAALVATLLGSGLKVHEIQTLTLNDLPNLHSLGDSGGDLGDESDRALTAMTVEPTGAHARTKATVVLRVTTGGMKERRAPMSTQFVPWVRAWVGWLEAQGAPAHSPLFLSSEDENSRSVDPDLELDLLPSTALTQLKPMSSTQIWRAVHGMLTACGFEAQLARKGPTVLRNTFATRQLRMGVPLATVALWLGHKDPNSTKVFESLLLEPGKQSVR